MTEGGHEVSKSKADSLGSFPASSSIITLAFTEHGTQSDYKPDLISRDLVSLETTEEYFAVYQKPMEPCIYQILANI